MKRELLTEIQKNEMCEEFGGGKSVIHTCHLFSIFTAWSTQHFTPSLYYRHRHQYRDKQSKRSLASFTSCVKQYPFLQKYKCTKNELHKIHSFSLTSHLSLFLSSLKTAQHNLHKSSRHYEKNTRVFLVTKSTWDGVSSLLHKIWDNKLGTHAFVRPKIGKIIMKTRGLSFHFDRNTCFGSLHSDIKLCILLCYKAC